MHTPSLLTLLLVTGSACALAQGHSDNLEKYRHYRERLVTQFMVVGDEPGMSMPVERIDTATATLVWSDNTIWLGWHIGMLALEYHLLTDDRYTGFDNGNTAARQQTLDELGYALAALVRLDVSAETAFPPPCDTAPGARNGFFIRDDVPTGFHARFPGMSATRSDATDLAVYNNEMSQDQVYHLLLGLALVKKFIPDSIQVRGMRLRQEAVAEALLIAEWVNRNSWIIKNPACQNKDVDRGENASLLSFGINECVKFFSDNTVNYDSDISQLSVIAWSSLASPANPAYANANNLHMAMALGATGRAWGDTTMNVLMTLAQSNRWSAYPLLCAALHDDTAAASFAAFRDTMNRWSEDMLDEAPPEGPYTLYPDTVQHGYAVNNRFIRPRIDHYTGYFFTINCLFNGLDYMMLHNLYYTVTPAKWPTVVDAINPRVAGRLEVFPNPAIGNIYIRVPVASSGMLRVEVLNAVGTRVDGLSVAGEKGLLKISMDALPAGMYFIALTDKAGVRTVGKVVLSK